MDQAENLLLNHLDKPLRFLGIHKDEAILMMVPFIGGTFMGWILTGFLVGVGFLMALRSLKKKNEGSSLTHALYWHLPVTKKSMKLYVPSHIREGIG